MTNYVVNIKSPQLRTRCGPIAAVFGGDNILLAWIDVSDDLSLCFFVGGFFHVIL